MNKHLDNIIAAIHSGLQQIDIRTWLDDDAPLFMDGKYCIISEGGSNGSYSLRIVTLEEEKEYMIDVSIKIKEVDNE